MQCGVKGQTVFNPSQCVPAFNPALPTPPKVGMIVAATDPNWTSYVTYKMPDNDVVAIKTGATPSIAGYYSGVGTDNLGLAVNPITGDLYVANTDALNLTTFQPNLDGHWINSRITQIQVATGKITPFDLNPNINYSILPNPQALSTALSQPAGVVFDPGGSLSGDKRGLFWHGPRRPGGHQRECDLVCGSEPAEHQFKCRFRDQTRTQGTGA